jgi:hypothetical protein
MIAHHARLEDQPPAGATQAQAQVEILVVKEEPGVETTDLTPGIWGDGYCGCGDKANLPPAASGGRGMLLPDSPRQVIEPPTGIPIVGCIVSAPNRPASCADPVFESIGRRIQETFGEHGVIVEDQEERATVVVVDGIESQIGSRAETGVVRTGHELHIGLEAHRIHVARIVDHHHATFDSRSLCSHRRQAALGRLGISEMNDGHSGNCVRHPDPNRSGRKPMTQSVTTATASPIPRHRSFSRSHPDDRPSLRGGFLRSRYNRPVATEIKLPIAIFAGLVALIAIPFLVDHFRELRRPLLLEARVVTATTSDPVFREGRRQVQATEPVEAALALRIGRSGTDGRWFAPVGRLAIDKQEREHVETDGWPEVGRKVRVFWFSVESTNLGGGLNAENAGERLRYRTYLAPEMGRGLRAERLPETHNDDHIGQQTVTSPDGAGTVRLYARVEVVESDSDVRPLQVVTTIGVNGVFEPEFPTLSRSADFGDALDGSVGELFGLPGFEPRSETGDWNEITLSAFGRTFTDLVSERFVVSSATLAAVAVAGSPDVDASTFTPLGKLEITPDRVVRRGGSLRWEVDVHAGDLLVDGNHWWVLLGDNGNGELDPADAVLHCWGRPPEQTTLDASLETEKTTVEHLRHAD